MPDAIGPGDWVEFVRDAYNHHKGEVVQVISLGGIVPGVCKTCNTAHPVWIEVPGTTVTMQAMWHGVGGPCTCAVRPMRRNTDFTSLLTTTPTEREIA